MAREKIIKLRRGTLSEFKTSNEQWEAGEVGFVNDGPRSRMVIAQSTGLRGDITFADIPVGQTPAVQSVLQTDAVYDAGVADGTFVPIGEALTVPANTWVEVRGFFMIATDPTTDTPDGGIVGVTPTDFPTLTSINVGIKDGYDLIRLVQDTGYGIPDSKYGLMHLPWVDASNVFDDTDVPKPGQNWKFPSAVTPLGFSSSGNGIELIRDSSGAEKTIYGYGQPFSWEIKSLFKNDGTERQIQMQYDNDSTTDQVVIHAGSRISVKIHEGLG